MLQKFNSKVKKSCFLFVLVGLVLSLLLLPFLTIFQKKLSYYVLKGIVYQSITDNVTRGLKNDMDISISVVNFVRENINLPYGLEVKDIDVLHDLVRGFAYCDQEAWAMATLLSRRGIRGRVMMVSRHSLLEVFLDGEWRLFEPWWGIYAEKDDSGHIATLSDVIRQPQMFTNHPKFLLMRRFDLHSFKKKSRWLKEVLKEAQQKSSRRYITFPFQKRTSKQILDFLVGFYCRVFGRLFATSYIDSYMRFNRKYFEPDYFIYYYSRLNHIVGCTARARKSYQGLIEDFPASIYIPDALYFLGYLELKNENYERAVEVLEFFNDAYPETFHRPYVLYNIGRAYEGLNKMSDAKNKYHESIAAYKQVEDYPSEGANLLETFLLERLVRIGN